MKKTFVLKIILFLLLFVSILRYYNEQSSELSQTSLSITLITLIITLILHKLLLSKEKQLNNNYLTISSLFIIGFILVHFFDYLGFVLGVNDSIIDINLVDSKIVNEAALCSLCSFIVYVMGYSSYKMSQNNYNKNNKYETGNILEISFLIFLFVFFLFMPKEYFNGGYGEILNDGSIPLIAALSQVFLQACQLGCSIDKLYRFEDNKHISFIRYVKSYSLYYYWALFAYFVLVISSGDRGPLITMSIIYIAPLFLINKNKFSLKYAIICVSIAVMSLNMLATLRAMDGELSVSKIQEAQKYRKERYENENTIFTSVSELSNVVRSYHAIYGFHDNTISLYGMGIVNQFLSFIPGLRFILYPTLGINENFLNSSYIATNELGKDHGMGTTCVGDTYLNLGFIGTNVFFYLFGMATKIMDSILYSKKKSLFLLILGIAYLANGIYMGRATCFAPINMAIYAYLFVLLTSKFYRKKYKMN